MPTTLPSPAPLGLLGYGMTVTLLCMTYVAPDTFPLGSMVISMAFFFAGPAEFVTGIIEFKRGQLFGAISSTAYGFFWWSLTGLLVMPNIGWASKAKTAFIGWYLFFWGVFTFFLFICTLKGNFAGKFIYATLTLLFLLLAIWDWTGADAMGPISGVVGIISGLAAIYTAMAEVVNTEYGRVIMPLGEPKESIASESETQLEEVEAQE